MFSLVSTKISATLRYVEMLRISCHPSDVLRQELDTGAIIIGEAFEKKDELNFEVQSIDFMPLVD